MITTRYQLAILVFVLGLALGSNLVRTTQAEEKPDGPEITFVGFLVESPRVAVFRVTNRRTTPIYYSGRSAVDPLYQPEVKTGELFEELNLAWCGTDLQRQRLDPGASIEIPLAVWWLEEKGEFRVGIGFCLQDRCTREHVYWSDAVQFVPPPN